MKGDPEITITDADRRTWFETARDLHQLQAKANDVAEMVQNAFAQVQVLQQQTRNATVSPNAKQQLDASSRNSKRFAAGSASVSRAVAAVASAATPKTCAAASAS